MFGALQRNVFQEHHQLATGFGSTTILSHLKYLISSCLFLFVSALRHNFRKIPKSLDLNLVPYNLNVSEDKEKMRTSISL